MLRPSPNHGTLRLPNDDGDDADDDMTWPAEAYLRSADIDGITFTVIRTTFHAYNVHVIDVLFPFQFARCPVSSRARNSSGFFFFFLLLAVCTPHSEY